MKCRFHEEEEGIWVCWWGFFENNHLLYICHAITIALSLLKAHQLAGEAATYMLTFICNYLLPCQILVTFN